MLKHGGGIIAGLLWYPDRLVKYNNDRPYKKSRAVKKPCFLYIGKTQGEGISPCVRQWKSHIFDHDLRCSNKDESDMTYSISSKLCIRRMIPSLSRSFSRFNSSSSARRSICSLQSSCCDLRSTSSARRVS